MSKSTHGSTTHGSTSHDPASAGPQPDQRIGLRRYEQNRIFTLNDPQAPRLSPALAAEIGLPESLLFLQIEFLCAVYGQVREERPHDTRPWIRISLRELRQGWFIFLSVATIGRHINTLDTRQLIDYEEAAKGDSNRQSWLTINLHGARNLTSIVIANHFIDPADTVPEVVFDTPPEAAPAPPAPDAPDTSEDLSVALSEPFTVSQIETVTDHLRLSQNETPPSQIGTRLSQIETTLSHSGTRLSQFETVPAGAYKDTRTRGECMESTREIMERERTAARPRARATAHSSLHTPLSQPATSQAAPVAPPPPARPVRFAQPTPAAARAVNALPTGPCVAAVYALWNIDPRYINERDRAEIVPLAAWMEEQEIAHDDLALFRQRWDKSRPPYLSQVRTEWQRLMGDWFSPALRRRQQAAATVAQQEQAAQQQLEAVAAAEREAEDEALNADIALLPAPELEQLDALIQRRQGVVGEVLGRLPPPSALQYERRQLLREGWVYDPTLKIELRTPVSFQKVDEEGLPIKVVTPTHASDGRPFSEVPRVPLSRDVHNSDAWRALYDKAKRGEITGEAASIAIARFEGRHAPAANGVNGTVASQGAPKGAPPVAPGLSDDEFADRALDDAYQEFQATTMENHTEEHAMEEQHG